MPASLRVEGARATTTNPIPQQIPAAFRIERAQGRDTKTLTFDGLLGVDGRQLFQRSPRFLQVLRGTQRCLRSRRPALAQRCDDAMTDKIAVERQIRVGRIGEPMQPLRPRPQLQVGAREIPERPEQCAARKGLEHLHRAQPQHAGTSHQRE